MGLTNVKRELQNLDKAQLLAFVLDLYKKNATIKEALDFYTTPNEEALFEKYRQKVAETFHPKRGFDLKLREGKKAISDFKKLGVGGEWVVRLMLFYVKSGIKFTSEFGDINGSFYSSLENTFDAALKLAKKEEVLPQFSAEAKEIVDSTYHIGWGLHRGLSGIHADYYGK